MKEILSDIDRWQARGEEIVLATLVRVEGSAPRLAGARLALTRSGSMAGSVSAGCVESDIVDRSVAVFESGRPDLAGYRISDEAALEVGLSCGGSIDVLIEPFRVDAAWRAVRAAVEARQPAVLALGLSPKALQGRRLAVVGDGPHIGSIDADLDAPVVAAAREMLPEGGTRVEDFEGLGDGEPSSVFIEAFPVPLRLFIVGATHVAIHLGRGARELGFEVIVIDPRSPFASDERFPEADLLVRSWPGEALASAGLDSGSYVVTLSHDPKFDIPALACALRSGAAYIGALGSRATQARRRQQLLEEGLTAEELARIHGPIGLDLGGRAPAEIALAILAEMVAVRHGRDPGVEGAQRRPSATSDRSEDDAR